MRALWIFALGSLAGCTLLLNTDAPTCDGFGGRPKVECAVGTCSAQTHRCEGGGGSTGGGQVVIGGQVDHVTSQGTPSSPLDLTSVGIRGAGALDLGGQIAWSDQISAQRQAAGWLVSGVPEGRYALAFTFPGTPDGVPGGYYLIESTSRIIDLGYGTLGRGGPPMNQTVQYVINNGTAGSSNQDVRLLDPDAPANFDLGSEILNGLPNGSTTVADQAAVQAGDRAVVGAVSIQTSASGLPYIAYSATGDAGISSGPNVEGILQPADTFSTNLGALGVEQFISNVSLASGSRYQSGHSAWAQYSIPAFDQAINPAALDTSGKFADCSGETDLVDGGLDWRDVSCPFLFGAQPYVVSSQIVTFGLKEDAGNTSVVRLQVKPLDADPLVIPIEQVPLNVQVNGTPIDLAGEYPLALGSGDLTISWTPVPNATRYFITDTNASFFLYADGQPSGVTASVTIPAAVLQEVFASSRYEELVIESIVDSNPAEVLGKPFRAASPLAIQLNTLVRLNITP